MAMQVHCGTYLDPTNYPLQWVLKQSPSAASAWMGLLLARRTQPAALSEHYFYIGISSPQPSYICFLFLSLHYRFLDQ